MVYLTHSRAPTLGGTSKAQAVYEALREDILNGVIMPNERLVERDLGERLGVSKTPIREALSMLRDQGLVRGRYYRGMTVVPMPAHTVHELYEMREVLEGLAARNSAAVGDPRQVEELAANIAAQESSMFNESFYGLNAAFHQVILDHCGNAELKRVLQRLYDQYRVLTRSGINPLLNQPKAKNRTILREHKVIAVAIANRDVAGAEEAARLHVHNAYHRLQVGETPEPSSLQAGLSAGGTHRASDNVAGDGK